MWGVFYIVFTWWINFDFTITSSAINAPTVIHQDLIEMFLYFQSTLLYLLFVHMCDKGLLFCWVFFVLPAKSEEKMAVLQVWWKILFGFYPTKICISKTYQKKWKCSLIGESRNRFLRKRHVCFQNKSQISEINVLPLYCNQCYSC